MSAWTASLSGTFPARRWHGGAPTCRRIRFWNGRCRWNGWWRWALPPICRHWAACRRSSSPPSPGRWKPVTLATGASSRQEIVWGVIPQVGPLWSSYGLYRFESNARSATVLGLIGAGGIGQLLFDNLNGYDYASVSAIASIIVVAVTLIDILSQQIRKRLL